MATAMIVVGLLVVLFGSVALWYERLSTRIRHYRVDVGYFDSFVKELIVFIIEDNNKDAANEETSNPEHDFRYTTIMMMATSHPATLAVFDYYMNKREELDVQYGIDEPFDVTARYFHYRIDSARRKYFGARDLSSQKALTVSKHP